MAVLAPIVAAVFTAGSLVQLAVGVGLSLVSQLLAKKEKGQSNRGTQHEFSVDPNQTATVPFGRTVVAGSFLFANTYGKKNNTVIYVRALSDVPINGISGLIVNDEKASFTNADSDGWHTVTKENGSSLFKGRMKFKFYDGTQTSADPYLVNKEPGWTQNHKCTGTAYVIVKLSWNAKDFDSRVPEFKWIVDGISCWDPRDTTQLQHDQSTWKLSSNPAIVLINYFMGIGWDGYPILGIHRSIDELDLAVLIDSANICDELVTDINSVQHKRYTCGGLFDAATPNRSHIDALVEAMGGSTASVNGKFRYLAGKARVSSGDIHQNDFLTSSDFKVVYAKARKDLINTVTTRYVNPKTNYQLSQIVKRTDAALVAKHGNELLLDFDLEYVQNEHQAQRIAEIVRREAQFDTLVNSTIAPVGQQYKPGDWVKLTIPTENIIDRWFKVTATKENVKQVGVDLTLQEVHPDLYAFGIDDETAPLPVPSPVIYTAPIFDIEDWTIRAALLARPGSTDQPSLHANWDPVDDSRVTGIMIEYRTVGETDVRTEQVLDSEAGSHVWSVRGNTIYEARARAITNANGITNWTPWASANNTTTPEVIEIPPGSIVIEQLNPQAVQSLQREADISDAYLASYGLHQNNARASIIDLVNQMREVEAGDRRLETVRMHAASIDGRLSAEISETKKLIVAETGALAETISNMSAAVDDVDARITETNTAFAQADEAIAQQVQTVSTTVGNNTASIEDHSTAIDGINAQRILSVDANGNVASATLGAGPDGSAIQFAADRIFWSRGDGTNEPIGYISTINGEEKFVFNGAISASKITGQFQGHIYGSHPDANGYQSSYWNTITGEWRMDY